MNGFKKVLVLCPHVDDGELGCGGTIAKFQEEGKEVWYLVFSSAEKSVPEGLPKDVLKNEVRLAMKSLGLPEDHLILLDYEVRTFPEHRQEILDDMIKWNKELNPDLVLLPSTYDTHQDHQVISQEGFRAFKKSSILGYELPWNNLTFSTEGFVILEEKHLQKKLKALSHYSSQSKIYMEPDFTRCQARANGIKLNQNYAEAFEVIRLII